jgi:hypothetical protein
MVYSKIRNAIIGSRRNMDRNRIMELAAEELERKRMAIDAEIAEIRAQLCEARIKIPESAQLSTTVSGKKRRRTLSERKTQSLRMKKYWAAKRAKIAKARKAVSPKPKLQKAAASKAISRAMRIYWAKKKATREKKT